MLVNVAWLPTPTWDTIETAIARNHRPSKIEDGHRKKFDAEPAQDVAVASTVFAAASASATASTSSSASASTISTSTPASSAANAASAVTASTRPGSTRRQRVAGLLAATWLAYTIGLWCGERGWVAKW